jgi:hypothetical protein
MIQVFGRGFKVWNIVCLCDFSLRFVMGVAQEKHILKVNNSASTHEPSQSVAVEQEMFFQCMASVYKCVPQLGMLRVSVTSYVTLCCSKIFIGIEFCLG